MHFYLQSQILGNVAGDSMHGKDFCSLRMPSKTLRIQSLACNGLQMVPASLLSASWAEAFCKMCSFHLPSLRAEPDIIAYGMLLPQLSLGDSLSPLQCAFMFFGDTEIPTPFTAVQLLYLLPDRRSWFTTLWMDSTCMNYHLEHSVLKTDLNMDVEAAQT